MGDERSGSNRRLDAQRRRLMLALAGLALGGCSAPSPKSPAPLPQPQPPAEPTVLVPTTLVIAIEARSDINPDSRGRPAPLAIRLFELKSTTAFQAADFFALYDRDQATLGAELLGREQLIVQPGETQTVRRKALPDTRYLGVLAGYRELERSVWRAVVPTAPPREGTRLASATGVEQRITIACERAGIRIE